MIKCKLNNQPTLLLRAVATQASLKNQLKPTPESRNRVPKTFPVEFKNPSHPPVTKNAAKEKCDRDVLEALSRANQKAVAEYDHYIPFSRQMFYQSRTHILRGDMVDVKREGYDLAEQFIQKYPQSFKIRYPDKMSHEDAELSKIQVLCKYRKVEEAYQAFKELQDNEDTDMSTHKHDLDSLLDFFAFFNCSADPVVTPIVGNNGTYHFNVPDISEQGVLEVHKSHERESPHTGTDTGLVEDYRLKEGSVRWVSEPVPYSKSLYKMMNVEARNMTRVINRELDGALSDDPVKEPPVSGHRAQDHSNQLSVSVMGYGSSYAMDVLDHMKLHDLVTGENYDSIIQALIKFYNPKLAYTHYLAMLEAGFYPSMKTICPLVYSITHNTSVMMFAREGSTKYIMPILREMEKNPNAELSDELYANLFYGTHPEESDINLDLTAIEMYNYNILAEMKQGMLDGAFKMRYSVAYKILEAQNHFVYFNPRRQFPRDLNVLFYDLLMEHPDCFEHDSDEEQSHLFLIMLMKLAKLDERQIDWSVFYERRLPDIKALAWRWRTDSFAITAPINTFLNELRDSLFESTKTAKAKMSCETLESFADCTVWDMYRDLYQDYLTILPPAAVLGILNDMLRMMVVLDPNRTSSDYMIEKLEFLVQELLRMLSTTLPSNPEHGKTVPYLYMIITNLVDRLHDFLGAKISGVGEPLTQEHKYALMQLTGTVMKLLVKHEGIPSKKMLHMLILATLEAKEHKLGWNLLEMYQNYHIPLDELSVLTFVSKTPDWASNKDVYIGQLSIIMQNSLKYTIEQIWIKKRRAVEKVAMGIPAESSTWTSSHNTDSTLLSVSRGDASTGDYIEKDDVV